jgi:hypothetical protein
MKKMMFVLCFALLFVGACKEFLKPDRDAFIGEWESTWLHMSISKGEQKKEIVIDTIQFYCKHLGVVGVVDGNSAKIDTSFCLPYKNQMLIVEKFSIENDTLMVKYKINDTTSFFTKWTKL